MWPFPKREPKAKDWLTIEQAREVTKIYYADHDANCWYAGARFAGYEAVKIAVSSKEEAVEVATTLASEVLAKTGKRFVVEEGS